MIRDLECRVDKARSIILLCFIFYYIFRTVIQRNPWALLWMVSTTPLPITISFQSQFSTPIKAETWSIDCFLNGSPNLSYPSWRRANINEFQAQWWREYGSWPECRQWRGTECKQTARCPSPRCSGPSRSGSCSRSSAAAPATCSGWPACLIR